MYGHTAYEEIFIEKYFIKLHKTARVCGVWTKILSPHSKFHKMGTPPDWHRQKHKVLTAPSSQVEGCLPERDKTSASLIRPPDTCWGKALGNCNKEVGTSFFHWAPTHRSKALPWVQHSEVPTTLASAQRAGRQARDIHWGLSSLSWGVT